MFEIFVQKGNIKNKKYQWTELDIMIPTISNTQNHLKSIYSV